RVADLDSTFNPADGPAGLDVALDRLCARAEDLARDGAQLLVLSDRSVGPGAAPVPMLLALGAVHQRLIRTGLRPSVDLVVEAGDALDVHHLAALIGFGAGAVCPWLALRSVETLGEDDVRKEYP